MKSRVFLAAALAIVASCLEMLACTCVGVGEPAQEFERATSVFVGRVVGLRILPTPEGDVLGAGRIECLLEPLFISKGEDPQYQDAGRRVFKVRTGVGGGDCGFSFELGQLYAVYAWGAPDQLETSICSRTNGGPALKPAEFEFLNEKAGERDVKKTAQPGATDNPGDAQRLREDH